MAVSIALLLGACASTPDPELPEKEYYELAKEALKARNFSEAARHLESLETLYPFGVYAEQAQLDLIYAKYNGLDLEGAHAAADRFIRLHPQSPHVDYAYYVRGIASYNMDIGLAAQYFPMVDVTSRDPGEMRKSFGDFSQLVTRFPESKYAADAQQRMIEIRNRLAAYEIHAARYYIKREAFIAAANRAQEVVENYNGSPSVEDGLIIMVECYRQLGLNDYADDALAVLAANYPKSRAFDKNMHFKATEIEKQKRSLLNAVTFGTVGD
ncbi:MAG: outer membrane protein assembly factor BamD [Hahellaceae bacterium]|nr:outer membrane protein assembly factor BamD [Hahellaceae bacterium]MCP5170043.1 outer membrane protein assembly factor BamD [Hahellaceae bacterium]